MAYMHDIRCPCCTRKLMCKRTEQNESVNVLVVADPQNQSQYDTVTRCPSCKTYVGFTVKVNN